jgi:hypothetical protein
MPCCRVAGGVAFGAKFSVARPGTVAEDDEISVVPSQTTSIATV